MKKLIIPLLLLIVAAIVAGYAWSGGFSKVDISRQQSTAKWIAGSKYSGPAKSAKFGELFQRAGQLIETGELKGNPGGIYYNNPSDASGEIKAFVGIIVPDSAVTLPAGYELRHLPGNRQVLQARVKADLSLIPGKAYPALFDYARENGIPLTNEFIEEYFSKDEGSVQAVLQTDS